MKKKIRDLPTISPEFGMLPAPIVATLESDDSYTLFQYSLARGAAERFREFSIHAAKFNDKEKKNLSEIIQEYDKSQRMMYKAINRLSEKYDDPVKVKKTTVVKEELDYDPDSMEFDKPYKFNLYGTDYAIVKSKEKNGEILLFKSKKQKTNSIKSINRTPELPSSGLQKDSLKNIRTSIATSSIMGLTLMMLTAGGLPELKYLENTSNVNILLEILSKRQHNG